MIFLKRYSRYSFAEFPCAIELRFDDHLACGINVPPPTSCLHSRQSFGKVVSYAIEIKTLKFR